MVGCVEVVIQFFVCVFVMSFVLTIQRLMIKQLVCFRMLLSSVFYGSALNHKRLDIFVCVC